MQFAKKVLSLAVIASLPMLMVGCGGDDGKNGTNGSNGSNGSNGANGADGKTSLIAQTRLVAGDSQCFAGGIKIETGIDVNSDNTLQPTEVNQTSYQCEKTLVNSAMNFNRVATFPVCLQISATCNTSDETAAEIVAASTDGMTLIYTDALKEQIGFTDISQLSAPLARGVLAMGGEPTSIAVKGGYALIAVDTSADFINASGDFVVVDIATQTIVHRRSIGGQPDSVAISPDGKYAAIVIENQRDEDLNNGLPPQLPAGKLIVVDLSAASPVDWTMRDVNLTGIASLYAADPEPEFVDINTDNIAVVTLQENNHIALVDLATASVTNHFTAGAVDLVNVDLTDNRPALIKPVEVKTAQLREPDGVTWINKDYFATANEGDLNGGSRGFTVFNKQGEVIWDSGSALDDMAIRFGHYQDRRSDAKGNEPENIEMGVFGGNRYLFVNSERSSVIFVYDVADPTKPVFKQVLPASAAPEGGLAIPARNLYVVASENDTRSAAIRAGLNIYSYNQQPAAYPTVQSVNRPDGNPIPWSALSALTNDMNNPDILYSIEDSFFGQNRIFVVDISTKPALIVDEIKIMDTNNVFANSGVNAHLPSVTNAELAAMINADKSVNIDPEGLAKAADGGFWIASEGSGAAASAASMNLIFKTDARGVIESVIHLPAAVNNLQINNGYEGIAEYNNSLYVAFQRAWAGETNPRIGIYDLAAQSWKFVYYPLDAYSSQYAGGWVGLSEITSIGNGEFMVLERDNRGGLDAAIKRLYKINLQTVSDGDLITKTLIKDIKPALASTKGTLIEKVEGVAVTLNGEVYIVTDNDGVNDHSGETQLMNLGRLF
ncbi:esterase-like activity of phytase family protein [Cellvibrio fontiphilus]|uniref:Esterase-like activity of phytase family protein n=1 Tax=Cellvibrio fontiphilus TaxID=1815559 RepID=A0ABV7FH23_9GAMM